MSTLHIGSVTFDVANLDKVLFPDAGLTKRDLIAYYRRIAALMLPHLAGRPLALHRYPDGITGEGFIQQQAPDYFPSWIERATVPKTDGTITHALAGSEAALAYLAGQATITPHVWTSRIDRPMRPDRLVFDLDPSDDSFDRVPFAATAVRDALEDVGLPAFVMTTGSRGLHVVTPIDRDVDFETTRSFARAIADRLARMHPDALTTEQRKAKRDGRVYIDTLRNTYGHTTVPPYAVRARPGAPVATPLDWNEVTAGGLHARRYTVSNLFRRLGQKTCPWRALDDRRASLQAAAHRLSAA